MTFASIYGWFHFPFKLVLFEKIKIGALCIFDFGHLVKNLKCFLITIIRLFLNTIKKQVFDDTFP